MKNQPSPDIENMAACIVSIIDSMKLIDYGDNEQLKYETLSEIIFRKMKGYGIDLNKILGVNHLSPVSYHEGKLKFKID